MDVVVEEAKWRTATDGGGEWMRWRGLEVEGQLVMDAVEADRQPDRQPYR